MAIPQSLRFRSSMQVKLYNIKPAMKAEFLLFCKNTIRPWLIGVDQAKQSGAWILERDGKLQILIILESNDEPWSGIGGLGDFLDGDHPLPFEEVDDLRIP